MVGQNNTGFFASIIVAICFFITLAAPASAQVNNPADCPSYNRNWQCTSIAPNPATFTTCVETVRGGVVIDQRNRTFSGEAAFTQFINSAPAGTIYRQCGATPSCTQTTESRTSACPAGQQGLITETRTLNTGGVCNATSAWTVTSNTCGPCTQTTETRTLACPSGQVGEIIQTRTLNTNGVCGNTSQYVETSNTCRVPPSTTCVNPFGGTLQVGQSITAFRTSSTPFGQICESEVRVCQSNGTLTGSYTFQFCNPQPPQNCVLPWGGTLASGQSITAYRTSSTPFGQVCESETRTCTNGVLSGSYMFQTCNVQPPVTCANPFGGTLQVGQSITAYRTSSTPFGQICESETRTCQANGTLSGSYSFQNCTITPPANCALPWGGTIASGQSVTAYRTSSTAYGQLCESETRTCTNGVLSGSFTFQFCNPGTPQNCVLPWGGTIAHGQSVTAYKKVQVTQAATTNTSATIINNICAVARTTNLLVTAGVCSDIPAGSTNPTGNGAQTTTTEYCLSETRTCNNGVLSGSYTQQTCNATPSCTQTTETRINGQQCPTGQSGVITEQRTVNTNGVCGATSAWTVVSNTCQPVTPTTCVNPFGGTLQVGQSIIAYQSSNVPNGGTCYYETRVCQPNGTLSGSYTQQSCTITPPATCTFNGQVLQNGQSVTAYQTSTSPYGQICQSETRTCNNGNLSGSYTYSSCNVTPPQTCSFNGQILQNGQSVTAYRTSSSPYGQLCESQTRTCSNGTLSGSYTFQTCNVTQPQSCTTPWGTTIQNGQSVVAYQESNPAYGGTCYFETRVCNNGTLSGSFTKQSCTIGQPQVCNLPWGGTLQNGQSVTAYRTSSTPYGQVCESETRTCSNGALSGSFTFQTCSMTQPATCTLPNGQVIQNGQSVTYYQQSNPAQNTACAGETRTCSNGVLSGSYTNGTCTQTICARAGTSNTSAEACTTTTYNGGHVTGTSTSYNNQSQSQAQSQSQSNSGGNSSQSQGQAQPQSQSSSNSGNGSSSSSQSQSQAQAQSQSSSSSNSGGGVVVVNQNQSQAQAQAQQMLNGMMMTGTTGGSSMCAYGMPCAGDVIFNKPGLWDRMSTSVTRTFGN